MKGLLCCIIGHTWQAEDLIFHGCSQEDLFGDGSRLAGAGLGHCANPEPVVGTGDEVGHCGLEVTRHSPLQPDVPLLSVVFNLVLQVLFGRGAFGSGLPTQLDRVGPRVDDLRDPRGWIGTTVDNKLILANNYSDAG